MHAPSFIFHVRPLGHLVWQIPTEIDLSSQELAVTYSVHLAIAKALARRCPGLVHDEGVVSAFTPVYVIKTRMSWLFGQQIFM